MPHPSLHRRAGYLSVECTNAGGLEMAEACRALAAECLAGYINRVLVLANGCDPDGHHALRNAFTALILAGIPGGFRLALVTNTPRVQALCLDLERDLALLDIGAKVFAEESAARDWLMRALSARGQAVARRDSSPGAPVADAR